LPRWDTPISERSVVGALAVPCLCRDSMDRSSGPPWPPVRYVSAVSVGIGAGEHARPNRRGWAVPAVVVRFEKRSPRRRIFFFSTTESKGWPSSPGPGPRWPPAFARWFQVDPSRTKHQSRFGPPQTNHTPETAFRLMAGASAKSVRQWRLRKPPRTWRCGWQVAEPAGAPRNNGRVARKKPSKIVKNAFMGASVGNPKKAKRSSSS